MSATRNPFAVVQRLIDKALAGHCPHRVGELYITMTDAHPEKTWPGTEWKQITDCFIRAADSSHAAGSTGGAWTHKQTYAETPPQGYVLGYGINQTTGNPQEKFPAWSWYFETGTLKQNSTEKTMLAAKPTDFHNAQSAMDITNKYITAYVWQRTK